MKKYLLMFVLVALPMMASSIAQADGCFLCSGGGYVKYTGDDTFDKRKKAKEEFGCEVSGTTSSCSNPKGSLSQINESTETVKIAVNN